MKNIIILLAIIFLGLNNLDSSAQTKFGIKAGVNFSPKPGYTVGLAVLHDLPKNLNFQTGININKYRSGSKKEYQTQSVVQKRSVTYLEVPLNLGYKFSDFQVFAEPYIGFAIDGGGTYYIEDKTNPQNSINGNYTYYIMYKFDGHHADTEEYVRSFDLGLKLGAGYDLGHFLFSSTGSIGLTDTYPVTKAKTDFKSTNLSLTLATTYFF